MKRAPARGANKRNDEKDLPRIAATGLEKPAVFLPV
jgi:hypothetical protein